MTDPTPLRVTAVLDSTAVQPAGLFGLDGPLAWGFVERGKTTGQHLPPLTPDFAPDFPLPLARHDSDPWIWCTSRAHWDATALTTIQIRRKPATGAMARYSTATKHHVGLGPYKARDTVLSGLVASTVWWDVLATDVDDLHDLLGYITHLGPRRRNGFGHVTNWIVDATEPAGWMDRPMPSPDGIRTETVRAPYWHHTRRALVC